MQFPFPRHSSSTATQPFDRGSKRNSAGKSVVMIIVFYRAELSLDSYVERQISMMPTRRVCARVRDTGSPWPSNRPEQKTDPARERRKKIKIKTRRERRKPISLSSSFFFFSVFSLSPFTAKSSSAYVRVDAGEYVRVCLLVCMC